MKRKVTRRKLFLTKRSLLSSLGAAGLVIVMAVMVSAQAVELGRPSTTPPQA
jgi:hypothetical protein